MNYKIKTTLLLLQHINVYFSFIAVAIHLEAVFQVVVLQVVVLQVVVLQLSILDQEADNILFPVVVRKDIFKDNSEHIFRENF